MTESWRVFCAVELPDEVRARLEDHIVRLRKQVPDASASWSRVENIHLTLKFFGNVRVDRIPRISEAAKQAVREFSMFEIVVRDTGVFPRASRPQVLWIGISDQSERLAALQQRLENECAAEGFEKEDRAYRPHLTIARIRKPDGARRLAEAHMAMTFEPMQMAIRQLIVFRSELSSKGSRYTPVSRVTL